MTLSQPGEALAAVVAAMDRLRSPGGCPWDAEQTHVSLAPYAIEEAYELAEAAESGDRAALRGELGDLLLQVVFHARVAEEHPDEPFDLDDVARELLDKLVRRHPHVFADGDARSAAEVETAWHEIKKREREGQDVLTGIPAALPALARAQKVARRLRREGADDATLLHPTAPAPVPTPTPSSHLPAEVAHTVTSEPVLGRSADRMSYLGVEGEGDAGHGGHGGHAGHGGHGGHGADGAEAALGRELMALVLRADAAGLDAEAALRAHLRALHDQHTGPA